MSSHREKSSNQAFVANSLKANVGNLPETSTPNGDAQNLADYLFALVLQLKDSNTISKKLMLQLQAFAERQERESCVTKQEVNTHCSGKEIPSSRHIKFNDFFTSNFNY